MGRQIIAIHAVAHCMLPVTTIGNNFFLDLWTNKLHTQKHPSTLGNHPPPHHSLSSTSPTYSSTTTLPPHSNHVGSTGSITDSGVLGPLVILSLLLFLLKTVLITTLLQNMDHHLLFLGVEIILMHQDVDIILII